MSGRRNKCEGGRKPRFPELPPKYSSSRELRNKAEKLRRDRLNRQIEEIRSLVPIICNKTKKSETTRSNILRLTANFLRVAKLFPQEESRAAISGNDQSILREGLTHLESMDGFFFMLAEDGRVLFVSENVDNFIGYTQIDMMGQPIYDFTYPGDQEKVQTTINRRCSSSSSPTALMRREEEEEEGERQSFYIRLREKPMAKNDTPKYCHLHVLGRMKRTVGVSLATGVGHTAFLGVMRPVRERPITELNLMESVQDQYITRHLPDGRIIYADHRISTIAGYLPSEVQGKSAFNFFNPEDLPWTTMAMRHMFASSNGEGSTVYRLFTHTGDSICLKTKGFLEFNKTTNKIESFLCINTVVRPEEEEKYLNEQKERFSPFITVVQINAMTSSKPHGIIFSPSSSSSTQVSKGAVACLELLPSPSSEVSVISPQESPLPLPSLQPVTVARPTLKRSLSPQPLVSYKRSIMPPTELPALLKVSQKRRLDDECGDKQRKLVDNRQYINRNHPIHRVEDGQRILDIDQEEQYFTSLVANSQLEALANNTLTNCVEFDLTSLIQQHNESHHMNIQSQSEESQSCPIPPLSAEQQRKNSVIRVLPSQGGVERRAAVEQGKTGGNTKEDLIAERLKIKLNLLLPKTEKTAVPSFAGEEANILSLLGTEDLITLNTQALLQEDGGCSSSS